MGTYYTEKEALQSFYDYWKKVYLPLEDFHWEWLNKNGQILRVKNKQVLFKPDDPQENLYIVLRGLLIKEHDSTATDQKQILTVALPNMGFFTTMHYYSQSPALGDIVAIRPGIVLQIPYKNIKPYLHQDQGIDTLLQLFMHKKKYQLDHLRYLDTLALSTNRLYYLEEHLPMLYRNLTRRELASLLLMSASTLYRASRKLAKGKK